LSYPQFGKHYPDSSTRANQAGLLEHRIETTFQVVSILIGLVLNDVSDKKVAILPRNSAESKDNMHAQRKRLEEWCTYERLHRDQGG
jgi:hypothetical protein